MSPNFLHHSDLLSGDIAFAEQQETVKCTEQHTGHSLDDGNEFGGALWKVVVDQGLAATQRCFVDRKLDQEVDDKWHESSKNVSGSVVFLNHAENETNDHCNPSYQAFLVNSSTKSWNGLGFLIIYEYIKIVSYLIWNLNFLI